MNWKFMTQAYENKWTRAFMLKQYGNFLKTVFLEVFSKKNKAGSFTERCTQAQSLDTFARERVRTIERCIAHLWTLCKEL